MLMLIRMKNKIKPFQYIIENIYRHDLHSLIIYNLFLSLKKPVQIELGVFVLQIMTVIDSP